eukprot:2835781-Rhodomonas_salina.1
MAFWSSGTAVSCLKNTARSHSPCTATHASPSHPATPSHSPSPLSGARSGPPPPCTADRPWDGRTAGGTAATGGSSAGRTRPASASCTPGRQDQRREGVGKHCDRRALGIRVVQGGHVDVHADRVSVRPERRQHAVLLAAPPGLA